MAKPTGAWREMGARVVHVCDWASAMGVRDGRPRWASEMSVRDGAHVRGGVHAL